jgi:ribosomal protein L11 methyltransferase
LFYPALDVANVDGELVLAAADDYSLTAAEERAGCLTLFFPDRVHRDRAREAIAGKWPLAVTTPRDVDDEDWARRSQQNLEPVTVGRITLLPNRHALVPNPQSLIPNPQSLIPNPQSLLSNPQSLVPDPYKIAAVIEPSMGFGTGHHATTRLCLEALQAIDLAGRFVLDIGTGSGVLAIAARLLGARGALGIDNDADAIQAARANLRENPGVDAVAFQDADLMSWLATPRLGPLPSELSPPYVVTANLTGVALVRAAGLLAAVIVPGGSLIVSGLLAAERDEVVASFVSTGRLQVARELEEDGWVGLILKS